MIARGRPRAMVYLVPAAALLAVTLPHLAQGDFRTDTGTYAAIALDAWRSGSWWTLDSGPGQPYFNKPPLVFWIEGVVLGLAGPHLGWARVPSVVAALLSVLLTTRIAHRLAGRRVALSAGVALALTYEFFRRTREISLDLWLLVFLLAAALMVVEGARRERARAAVLAGIPLGLGLLCKPLVALAAIPLLAAWAWSIGWKRGVIAVAAAGVVAILVALPWHASMALTHDRFIETYFGAQVAHRAAGTMTELGHETQPPWFYVRQILATHWPWLLFVALAAVSMARQGIRTRRRALAVLAIVWCLGWLAVLSVFPDRRDRYALPYMPALAWIAALWLADDGWGWLRRAGLVLARRGAVIAAAIGVIAAIVPMRVQRPPDPEWIALFDWIRARDGDLDRDWPWSGGMQRARAARLYLEFGRWPRYALDPWGDRIDEPPAGALVIYHARDGLAPGPGETEIFEHGVLRVTRLDQPPWSPISVPDPGD